MVQTIDRIKGCVVLSKHEAGAGATKIYRLAHTVNPPLDGGPAVLPTAGGCQGGNPPWSFFAFFLSIQKEGPRRRGGRRDALKITIKGRRGTSPPPPHSPHTLYNNVQK